MEKNLKKIVLMGPQASGKSTQTKVITDFLGVPAISTSQVLRDVVEKGSEMGKKIEVIMDRGDLVPDEHVINLVLGQLNAPSCLRGFLLDGFPRNLVQAKALDDSCGVDMVFSIDISDNEAIRRISGRRICREGHVFHTEYKPSSQGDICDICQGELFQREDDKEDVVKKRLAIYRDQTEQLLAYYSKQGKLKVFDGEKPIEMLSQDILNYLKKYVGSEKS
ncbi:nucleoside monophosphate kinase [Patescibacteria group bacterium]|nr:nucleoside monophosphate kinase [Patescibacteria group bacterium]